MKKPKALFILFLDDNGASRSAVAQEICNVFGNGKVIAESAIVKLNAKKLAFIEMLFCKPKNVIKLANLTGFDVLVNMSSIPGCALVKECLNFTGIIVEWWVDGLDVLEDKVSRLLQGLIDSQDERSE